MIIDNVTISALRYISILSQFWQVIKSSNFLQNFFKPQNKTLQQNQIFFN